MNHVAVGYDVAVGRDDDAASHSVFDLWRTARIRAKLPSEELTEGTVLAEELLHILRRFFLGIFRARSDRHVNHRGCDASRESFHGLVESDKWGDAVGIQRSGGRRSFGSLRRRWFS